MEKEYLDLIVRLLTDEISDDELKLLNNWLNKSHKNRVLFDQLKTIIKSSGEVFTSYIPDTNKEWKKLKTKLNSEEVKSPRVVLWKKHLWKVAAVFILFIGIGILFNKKDSGKEIIYYSISTKENIKVFELPDKSVIHLNKNSKLSIPEKIIDSVRNVTLVGEAYFKVKADKNFPFVVTAGNTKTKVLGTAFNIKAYEEDDVVEVDVEEGKVEFSNMNEKIFLKKNDKATYNNKTNRIKKSKSNKNEIKWWLKSLEKHIEKLFKKIEKKINT